jgi:TusA-related sulfurtransferase
LTRIKADVDPAPDNAPMNREITLDVRGMEAPEPLEKVLETIDDFAPGDTLRLVIDCRPMPLYRILERNGYACREAPGTDSNYVITIWRK